MPTTSIPTALYGNGHTYSTWSTSCPPQAQNATVEAKANRELAERISCLEEEVSRHREDAGRAQAEVDRLLEILREMENEKNDKDKKINELER